MGRFEREDLDQGCQVIQRHLCQWDATIPRKQRVGAARAPIPRPSRTWHRHRKRRSKDCRPPQSRRQGRACRVCESLQQPDGDELWGARSVQRRAADARPRGSSARPDGLAGIHGGEWPHAACEWDGPGQRGGPAETVLDESDNHGAYCQEASRKSCPADFMSCR
jgi:hypothetical protein